MAFTNNLTRWWDKMNKLRAKKMIEIGEVGVDMLRDRLGNPYPPASVPGEYPHKRTGNLQRSVRLFPATASALVSKFGRKPMTVVLGYAKQAFYGYILVGWGRKGPEDVAKLKELKNRAQAIMNRK